MIKIMKRLMAVAFFTSALNTYALPIAQADAFSVGDKMAMKDTTSGLIWLDFGVTNNQSFNQVVERLNTTYRGWRLPTNNEVFALFNTLFASQPGYGPHRGWCPSCYNSLYQTPATAELRNIFEIFGVNASFPDNQPYNWGWFLDNSNHLQGMSFYISNLTEFSQDSPDPIGMGTICCINSYNYDSERDYISWASSTLLVRSSVPEPTTFILLVLGLACLIVRRRTVK